MIDEIKHDELLLLTQELDGMLIKHVEWLSLLHKTIICNLPSSNLLSMHDHNCDFGKWYYSVTHPELIENREFIHPGETHKSLHVIANRILDQYENNVVTNENEYDLFIDTEKQFFNELNNFIDDVLSTKSKFDYLTNIPNRKLVTLILKKEYSKVTRNSSECYVAFADIDHFKHVNDTYGHIVGDIVLKEIARYFSDTIRGYDTVGRYGGEEFIFCFPNTDLNEAHEILERIRCGIEELSIPIDESNKIKITCSFGLSKMSTDNTLTEIIDQADNAMYVAKNSGRNRIKVWSKKETI